MVSIRLIIKDNRLCLTILVQPPCFLCFFSGDKHVSIRHKVSNYSMLLDLYNISELKYSQIAWAFLITHYVCIYGNLTTIDIKITTLHYSSYAGDKLYDTNKVRLLQRRSISPPVYNRQLKVDIQMKTYLFALLTVHYYISSYLYQVVNVYTTLWIYEDICI